MELIVKADGTITGIYSDDLLPVLNKLGSFSTNRASFVEPGTDNTWTIDLSISNGPIVTGFRTRKEALDYEVAWLRENL